MRSINCTEFKRLLEAAVESHRSVEIPELGEHAAVCPGCRADFDDVRLLDRAVARWKRDIPSVDLVDTVLYRLETEAIEALIPEAPRDEQVRLSDLRVVASADVQSAPARLPRSDRLATGRPRRAALTAALALSFVVGAVVLAKRPIGQKRAPIATHLAKATTQSPAPRSAKRPGPLATDAPVQSFLHHAESASLQLAGVAAKAVTAAAVLVPPADSAEKVAPHAKEKEGWADEVRRELAPVQRHLGHALGFLFQAVPAEKAPAT